jgi:CheY-like chemotaxis protein
MARLVLQVEDSSDDARLLELAFRRARVSNPLVTVNSAEEAISYFKGEGVYADRAQFPLPGILLVDLKLPGIDGFELVERLMKESLLQEVLVLMITGHHEVYQMNRAYSLGAKSFIVKPVNEADLANLLKGFETYWAITP